MDKELKVPKRILSSLLSSIAAGVVPRTGAPYIAIGRNEEINALLTDLNQVSEGGSTMRFIIGKYGSGKSFLIQLIRGYALEKGFICADCDLSPERRLCGTNGAGLATYRELIKNLSSKTSPDGNALPQVISRWLSSIQMEVAAGGYAPDTPEFERAVKAKVYEVARSLESQIGGFDFARVISLYYEATKNENEMQKSACIRWLRGEYETKTEARRELGVGSIIDDENWFDYIKLMAAFSRKIGYMGFVVFIDECVNLYKITNRVSRENNYEKLLSMFNDSLQGRSEGLGIILGGTPQFLEDTRRGLFSYDALRSRLADSRFASDKYKNMMGPVIRLKRMSDNELLALIARITILHSQYHNTQERVTPENMQTFLAICLERAGADSMITPREIIREYLTILDIMLQNPDVTFDEIIGKNQISLKSTNRSAESEEFSDFDISDIEI